MMTEEMKSRRPGSTLESSLCPLPCGASYVCLGGNRKTCVGDRMAFVTFYCGTDNVEAGRRMTWVQEESIDYACCIRVQPGHDVVMVQEVEKVDSLIWTLVNHFDRAVNVNFGKAMRDIVALTPPGKEVPDITLVVSDFQWR